MIMFKKVLVATDGSDPAKHALGFGAALAERDGAELVVLSVIPTLSLFVTEETELSYYPQLMEDMERFHEEMLAETSQDLERDYEDLKVSTLLRKGNPARNIVAAARDEGVDLIVIGNRGTGGIISWMLGSTSRSVAEACTVPVLIVKDQEYCEA
jgi:nucleotide-binding universal stress UspA family protein